MSSSHKTVYASFSATAPLPIQVQHGFGSYLYLGTAPDGLILRSKDGFYYDEFWRTGSGAVTALMDFGNALFAGTSPDGRVLMHNFNTGNRFHFVNTGDNKVSAMAVHDGMLFVGTSPSGLVLSFDGLKWVKEYDAYGGAIRSLASFSDSLYVFLDEAETIPIRGPDGGWSLVAVGTEPFALPGFSAVTTSITELQQNQGFDRSFGPSVVFGQKLYFAGGRHATLYSFDGSQVSRVFDAGDGAVSSLFKAADQLFLTVDDTLYVYEESG